MIRTFALNRIRSRFRDNVLELGAYRLDYLYKEGRQKLRFLKKANAGDTKAVMKALELTYGRRGKRKHDLLRVSSL